jgi:hypothetical protein
MKKPHGRPPPDVTKWRQEEAYRLRLKGCEYKEIGEVIGTSTPGAMYAFRRQERLKAIESGEWELSYRRMGIRSLSSIIKGCLANWAHGKGSMNHAILALQAIQLMGQLLGLSLSMPRPTTVSELSERMHELDASSPVAAGVVTLTRTLRRVERGLRGEIREMRKRGGKTARRVDSETAKASNADTTADGGQPDKTTDA